MPSAQTQARRDYQREWRRRRGTSVGRYTLTICADGYGRPELPLLVCGRPPGHPGPHHDVHWAIEWDLARNEAHRG